LVNYDIDVLPLSYVMSAYLLVNVCLDSVWLSMWSQLETYYTVN